MPWASQQLLNLDFSFPGIEFGYESWALESYLNVLDEQIEHARAQYRLRAKRHLDSEKSKLEDFEYFDKLNQIDDAADAQIPRFFRIGAVISIWGMFESFSSDLSAYAGRRENAGLGIRDIRADSLRVQIEKYFEKVLRIPLPWTPHERERLGHLQELRNFLAHRNGRVTDLPAESEKRVRSLVARIPGIEIETSAVVVSPGYVSEAAALVFKTLVLQTFLWVGSTLSRMVCKEDVRWKAWSCTGSCLG